MKNFCALTLSFLLTACASAGHPSAERAPSGAGNASDYQCGAPGSDGKWAFDETSCDGSDYDGGQYFRSLNDVAVPLQGSTLLGHTRKSKHPCSVQFIGFEDTVEHLLDQSRVPFDQKRGIYHIRFTEGKNNVDLYASRAGIVDSRTRRVRIAATENKTPVEMEASPKYASLECEIEPNSPPKYCVYSHFLGLAQDICELQN
jgi:hypothetical protein